MEKKSISLKILFSTALLILFSVFFVSYLSYKQNTKDLRNQSSEKVQQIIQLLSINIETYLDDLFRLSLSPYYSDDVMDALDKKISDNDLKFLNRERTIENFLDAMMLFPRKDILRVFILTDRIYKSERFPTSLDNEVNFSKYDWYQKSLKSNKPIFVPAHLEQIIKNPKNIVFSVVYKITSTRKLDRVLGVIKVDATYSGIQSICEKVNLGTHGGLLIIDENQNLIYNNTLNFTKDEFRYIYRKIQNNTKDYEVINIDNNSYLLNWTNISISNWRIIALSSLDEINIQALETRNDSFIWAFICSSFAIIILIIFMNHFLNPLELIISKIKIFQKGDFTVQFPSNNKDEIGYLGFTLNTMVSKIDTIVNENNQLITQVYEAKYLQKEAQISALYNQIHPHFIYNTLNMINLSIQCGKEDIAIESIHKLSTLLRGMSNWDKDITFKSEIKLLDSYLGIQKNRYNDRLDYYIDVDKSIYSITLPALLFQPIVENAVVHGCEEKKNKTFIKISSCIESNKIIIVIEDNGNGIDEKTLKDLNYKLNNCKNYTSEILDLTKNSSGIALLNVQRRIQLKYGKGFGLIIDSIINTGTVVKVVLPNSLDG